MARNLVTVSEVVNDFVMSIDGEDFARNISETIVHNHALRGIREMGFDVLQRVRSLKLSKNSNDTVDLPDDFVSLIKIGIVGADGLVYVLGPNQNINFSQKYSKTSGGQLIDSNGDGVFDRVDDKGSVSTALFGQDDHVVFSNYIYQNNVGQVYGFGGGKYRGDYRLNLDQNRIELAMSSDVSEVVIEYVADEARSENPTVHVMAEEALRAYIYYKIVQRKSTVPAGEKARARSEYFNELRRANSRLKSFSKEDALQVIRKNFKQSPKY
ncbi:MAG: hypothetical protein CMI60_07955 [Parvibaculum sp.]|nr:hypothetical protein [Parvibaculum sp.]